MRFSVSRFENDWCIQNGRRQEGVSWRMQRTIESIGLRCKMNKDGWGWKGETALLDLVVYLGGSLVFESPLHGWLLRLSTPPH